jgi:hypothetical protein
MSKSGWLRLVAAAVLAGGCGSSPSPGPGVELLPGFQPGPAPANGFQLVMPIAHGIAAGGSFEYCTWSDVVLDHDIDVKAVQGLQTVTGHHTVLYYTTNLQPAGQQRICSDADMASFRFGAGAGGEGVAAKNVLPGDLAVHIPKGAQLVVNHHYLNASAQTVDNVQSAMNVYLADPGAKLVRASSLAFVDTAMKLPVGLSSVDITCTVNKDYSTWYFIPHMHRWGQHVTVDHTSAGGTKRLFDVAWTPEYTFHPPSMTEDPSQPYVLHTGDQVHLHCDFNNTTGAAMPFGTEMCVAFAQTVDTANVGNLACDAGRWGPF